MYELPKTQKFQTGLLEEHMKNHVDPKRKAVKLLSEYSEPGLPQGYVAETVYSKKKWPSLVVVHHRK